MKFRITGLSTNATDSGKWDATFDVGEDDNTFIRTNVVRQIIKANTSGRQSLVSQVAGLAYFIWEQEHIGEVLGTVYPYDGVTLPVI